jgi:tripartite-type tricarboxylate transporter receptor subunit TctC
MAAGRPHGEDAMTKAKWLSLVAALLLAFAAPASAQTYPSGTIKIMVGFTPGGTTDIIARDVAIELEKAWHNTVIVENRAGANGALAAAQLAKAAPDGYTLMMVVSGHITNPLIMANAGYDPLKDFTNISLLASSPLLIFAHPGFAVNDIKSAIALAKEKPNTIGYATPGVGSIQQLSMELLSYLSGAKFLHVPYRGGAPALNDTIAGHVPISVLSVFQVLPLIQDGKLKPLAVTALKRSDVLPDTQTVAEAGVANYEASLLFGLIAPAGLPPDVLKKINAEVVRIINDPGMKKKLAAQGVLPIASSPDEFTAVIKAEQQKWAGVIKAANIKE